MHNAHAQTDTLNYQTNTTAHTKKQKKIEMELFIWWESAECGIQIGIV